MSGVEEGSKRLGAFADTASSSYLVEAVILGGTKVPQFFRSSLNVPSTYQHH